MMVERATLEKLLAAFMGVNNELRREAEKAWDTMKATAPDNVVEGLCNILRSGDEGLRAMAAVLLRTLFGLRSDIWYNLQQPTKFALKESLLRCIMEEPKRHICLKITHTIGQLASVVMSKDEGWPDILPFTVNLCGHSDPRYREIGLELLDKLSQYVSDSLAPHMSTLQAIFSKCLEDSEGRVQMAALKATCSFMQDLPDATSAAMYSPMVPKMLSVVAMVVNAGQEDLARDALSALQAIAEKQPQVLRPHLEPIGRGMLSLAGCQTLEGPTRMCALEFLVTFCENAPSIMKKSGGTLVQAMVPLILDLLSMMQDEESVEVWANKSDYQPNIGAQDAGEEEDEIGSIAAASLDRISMALGGEALLGIANPIISRFILDSDWRRRRAALVALAMLSEGCSEALSEQLDTVIPQLLKHANDPHPRVRYQLIVFLNQMCLDYAEDEKGTFQSRFHSAVLPVLINALGGSNTQTQAVTTFPRLQSVTASALVTFCNPNQCKSAYLRLVSKPLLEGLLCVAQCGREPDQEEALSAVGQVAHVLKQGFVPYYSVFANVAKTIIFSPGTTGTGVTGVGAHGKSMEALALMGEGVGVVMFRQDAHTVMQAYVQWTLANTNETPTDNGQCALACARIASSLGPEFGPYLPHVLPPMLGMLSADTSFKLMDGIEDTLQSETGTANGSGYSSITCNIKGLGPQVFGVNTEAMQSKRVACQVIYQYVVDIPGSLLGPYAETITRDCCANLHRGCSVSVRSLCAATLPKLISSIAQTGDIGLASRLLKGSIMPVCESCASEEGQGAAVGEEDMEPLSMAADAFGEIMQVSQDFGLLTIFTGQELDTILSTLTIALQRCLSRRESRISLSTRGDSDEDTCGIDLGTVDGQALLEIEDDILRMLLDGLSCLVKGLRASVFTYMETHILPCVFTCMLADTCDCALRILSLCLCIDVCQYCTVEGSLTSISITAPLLNACLKCMQNSDPDVRQAASYGIGIIAEHGGPSVFSLDKQGIQSVSVALTCLSAEVEKADNDNTGYSLTASDNAVAALFRMCVNRADAVEMCAGAGSRVSILTQTMNRMPLEGDIDEGKHALRVICSLLEKRDALVMLPQCFAAAVDCVLRSMAYHEPEDDDDSGSENGSENGSEEHAHVHTDTCGCGLQDENESDTQLWDCQFTDVELRARIKLILQWLQASHQNVLAQAWQKASEEAKAGAQMQPADFIAKLEHAKHAR